MEVRAFQRFPLKHSELKGLLVSAEAEDWKSGVDVFQGQESVLDARCYVQKKEKNILMHFPQHDCAIAQEISIGKLVPMISPLNYSRLSMGKAFWD
ncbi:hypothetical protein AVEN_86564-1 [Araneus ventricosus]|uniref:Uncharacterized protein n=1 Tax=Araneus ventricosus TaxID=182803 RepID=A0A4Y2SST9_ARAVE|nr:hypothetical protein AVEN_86564-1 [Araneus ventricosus]